MDVVGLTPNVHLGRREAEAAVSSTRGKGVDRQVRPGAFPAKRQSVPVKRQSLTAKRQSHPAARPRSCDYRPPEPACLPAASARRPFHPTKAARLSAKRQGTPHLRRATLRQRVSYPTEIARRVRIELRPPPSTPVSVGRIRVHPVLCGNCGRFRRTPGCRDAQPRASERNFACPVSGSGQTHPLCEVSGANPNIRSCVSQSSGRSCRSRASSVSPSGFSPVRMACWIRGDRNAR